MAVFRRQVLPSVDAISYMDGGAAQCGCTSKLEPGGHPFEPEIRNGLRRPEFGKEIHIGKDCWVGGNVAILPGVTKHRLRLDCWCW